MRYRQNTKGDILYGPPVSVFHSVQKYRFTYNKSIVSPKKFINIFFFIAQNLVRDVHIYFFFSFLYDF